MSVSYRPETVESIASLQTALSESEAAVDTTAGKKSCEIQDLLDSYSSLLHVHLAFP